MVENYIIVNKIPNIEKSCAKYRMQTTRHIRLKMSFILCVVDRKIHILRNFLEITAYRDVRQFDVHILHAITVPIESNDSFDSAKLTAVFVELWTHTYYM